MVQEVIEIPRYYRPWPHQQRAWQRRNSGLYNYYFKLWSRQTGKDTDDIQYCLRRSWDHPGTQSAYVGLDNVWITNNIFKKYIDHRTHWDDYPPEYIDVKDTAKEVYLTNNPEGYAQARIKFIGFLNDQGLIGSSYDNFYISELSLYKQNAFSFIQPIWDQKLSRGEDLFVGFNGTPRGTRNVMYEMMRTYSGVDDPAEFGGAHGNCYIDIVTVHDVMVPDKLGGYRPLYTEEELEVLQDRYLRQFGNLNLYRQEFECDFTVVNAGLVYQGFEQLCNEGRYTPYNLTTDHPVYAAFDISSKGSTTDATAAIIYQYYNGQMFVYDWYEQRGKSFVECYQELAQRDYFHLIRYVSLPWDSERSASSETPIEEARRLWPNVVWHSLEKERVDRGINLVRKQLPNMIVNSTKCDYLHECFNNYEYKRLEARDDWAATPTHNKYSHLMDALRYAVMGIKEMEYFQLDAYGAEAQMPDSYEGWTSEPKSSYINVDGAYYPEHWKRAERRTDSGIYY